MVITIEPGVYFNEYLITKALENPEVNGYLNEPMLRDYLSVGGVRIEDDVVVKESGPLVLTELAPKEVVEIERVMQGLYRSFG